MLDVEEEEEVTKEYDYEGGSEFLISGDKNKFEDSLFLTPIPAQMAKPCNVVEALEMSGL